MSVIYLIRHGQASFGQGNYDRLSDLGIRQARLLGAWFRTTGVRFDRVYSGTLERQIGTARAALAEACGDGAADGLAVRPEFDEFSAYSTCMNELGALAAADPELAAKVSEMSANRDALQRVTGAMLEKFRNNAALSPGGDQWKAFGAQVASGLDRVRAELADGGRAAIFTSGGTITVALQGILGLSDRHALVLARQTRNTSVSTLAAADGHLVLDSYNAVPHLEIEHDAALVTTI